MIDWYISNARGDNDCDVNDAVPWWCALMISACVIPKMIMIIIMFAIFFIFHPFHFSLFIFSFFSCFSMFHFFYFLLVCVVFELIFAKNSIFQKKKKENVEKNPKTHGFVERSPPRGGGEGRGMWLWWLWWWRLWCGHDIETDVSIHIDSRKMRHSKKGALDDQQLLAIEDSKMSRGQPGSTSNRTECE